MFSMDTLSALVILFIWSMVAGQPPITCPTPCQMGFTCAMVRHGTEPPRPGCISMEEAIMLHQALQGGPSGPGTGMNVPAQQQMVPSMNMLGVTPQGGFDQRFGQGIVGSPAAMFNQQQQPNSLAFGGQGMPQQGMGPFPFGAPGFQMGAGSPFLGMGGPNTFGTFGMPLQFGGGAGFGGPQQAGLVDPTTGQPIAPGQFRVNQGLDHAHGVEARGPDRTGGHTNHWHGSGGVGLQTGPTAGITDIANTCELVPCLTHLDCAGDTFCSRGKTPSCRNQLVCQPP